MLQYDLTAGLFVPPEIIIRQIPSGGTDIVYNLPSALIAGIYDCGVETRDGKRDDGRQFCDENALNLLKAAQGLDVLLGDLVQFIAA